MNTVLPFAVSFVVQLLALKYFCRLSLCVDSAHSFKPQRIHASPTPRAGGLGIFAGSLIVLSLVKPDGFLFVLCSLPAFLVGFVEDLSSRVNPAQRLFTIALGAALGAVLMDAVIFEVGFFSLPPAIAVVFTVFAVTGVANAINIVDGMNGLASGVSLITLLFLALAAYMFGDMTVFVLSLALLAATFGFFVFNFPGGKIFLGDGGAYFIGFAIAELSVMLVNRNPEISPWFPLALMAYPVTEVAFSVYRRRVKKGLSVFKPDRGHLHSLIYKRVTKSNARTSCVFWFLAAVFDAAAFFFLDNSLALSLVLAAFVLVYVGLYTRVVRFKTPALMKRLLARRERFALKGGYLEEGVSTGVEVYKQKLGEGQ